MQDFLIGEHKLHGYLPIVSTDRMWHHRHKREICANDISVIAEIEADVADMYNYDKGQVTLSAVSVINMYYYEGFKQICLYDGRNLYNDPIHVYPYDEGVTFPELSMEYDKTIRKFHEYFLYPTAHDDIFKTIFLSLEEASFRVFGEHGVNPEFVINKNDEATCSETTDLILFMPVEFTVTEHRNRFRRHGHIVFKACKDAHVCELRDRILVDKAVPVGYSVNPYDGYPVKNPRVAYMPYHDYFNNKNVDVKYPPYLADLDFHDPSYMYDQIEFKTPMLFRYGYAFKTQSKQGYVFHEIRGSRKKKEEDV